MFLDYPKITLNYLYRILKKNIWQEPQQQQTRRYLAGSKLMQTASNRWLVRAIGIQGCSDFLLQSTVIFTRWGKTQLEIAAFNSKPRRA